MGVGVGRGVGGDKSCDSLNGESETSRSDRLPGEAGNLHELLHQVLAAVEWPSPTDTRHSHKTHSQTAHSSAGYPNYSGYSDRGKCSTFILCQHLRTRSCCGYNPLSMLTVTFSTLLQNNFFFSLVRGFPQNSGFCHIRVRLSYTTLFIRARTTVCCVTG